MVNLKASIWKIYGRHYDLVYRYGIFVSQMTTDICDMCDAGTTSYSGTHEYITSTCISPVHVYPQFFVIVFADVRFRFTGFLLSFCCLQTLLFNYHSLSNMYGSIPDPLLMFDYHGRQTIWLRCHKKCGNYWYLNGYWFSSRIWRNNWKNINLDKTRVQEHQIKNKTKQKNR